MGELTIFDKNKKTTGKIQIDDLILKTPYHSYAVSETIRQFLSASQQGTHSTKGRSEVSYSNRKLYRQKGTGSARSGSAKSPIRRHGGVVFGPKNRSHAFRINKKTKKLATRSVFAEKVRKDSIIVIDSLELPDNKTRNLNTILKKLGLNDSVLLVTDTINDNLVLASRNIPKIHLLSHRSLNIYEMMKYKKVVFIKEALEAFKERLVK
tara:strand:- start:477 stop:1103 length:627 start_codon:yes stop_codon:yes gene_type:complete